MINFMNQKLELNIQETLLRVNKKNMIFSYCMVRFSLKIILETNFDD